MLFLKILGILKSESEKIVMVVPEETMYNRVDYVLISRSSKYTKCRSHKKKKQFETRHGMHAFSPSSITWDAEASRSLSSRQRAHL